MKRIEGKTKIGAVDARLSRTGGLTFSTRLKGVTFNSKHGIRITKSFQGLTLGLQNFIPVLRGRWTSTAGLSLNLSKSGVSLSQKNFIGTFNLTNPNKSSINIFGIQRRGKQAATIAGLAFMLQLILLPFKMIFWLYKFLFNLAKRLFLFSWWLLELVYFTVVLLGSVIAFLILDLPKVFKYSDLKDSGTSK